MKIKISLFLLAASFITLSAFLAPKHAGKKTSDSSKTDYDTQFQKTLSEINAFAVSYPQEKTHAYYFSSSVFNTLLKQKNAEGIRVYHSINASTGERDVVLVAIDKNGNDILPANDKAVPENSLQAANGAPCPAFCGQIADVFSLAIYGASTPNFNKKAGSLIGYNNAVAAVKAYRAKYPNEKYHAFAYTKAEINNLLSGADGIRIYHAVEASSGTRIIILAKAGANIKPNQTGTKQWIYYSQPPCPSYCSNANGLNS